MCGRSLGHEVSYTNLLYRCKLKQGRNFSLGKRRQSSPIPNPSEVTVTKDDICLSFWCSEQDTSDPQRDLVGNITRTHPIWRSRRMARSVTLVRVIRILPPVTDHPFYNLMKANELILPFEWSCKLGNSWDFCAKISVFCKHGLMETS